MQTFEDRLRDSLQDAASGVRAPEGFGVDVLVRRQAQSRRGERIAVAGVVAVLALVAGAAAVLSGGGGRDGGSGVIAPATPRSGAAGWSRIGDAPIDARFQHTAIWIGDEMLVFGGYGADGERGVAGAAAYDPSSGVWRVVAEPPGDMASAVAVWTGEHVLVLDGEARLYAYSPADDTWSPLARAPFAASGNAVTFPVWTGERLVAVTSADDEPRTASYDPATNEWTSLTPPPKNVIFADVAWTGDELMLSGPGGGGFALQVFAFDPAEDRWRQLPDPPLAQVDRRQDGVMVWTGTELVVGGGYASSDEAAALEQQLVDENREPTEAEQAVLAWQPQRDVAAWNPATGAWRPLPDAPVPVTGNQRYNDPAAGRYVVMWPASLDTQLPETPVLLDPATGGWTVGPALPSGGHQDAPLTWTGHELIVWSGEPRGTDTEPMQCCSPVMVGYAFTP